MGNPKKIRKKLLLKPPVIVSQDISKQTTTLMDYFSFFKENFTTLKTASTRNNFTEIYNHWCIHGKMGKVLAAHEETVEIAIESDRSRFFTDDD